MNRKQRRAAAREAARAPKELSLPQALALAMQLHQGSRLEEAEVLYRRILEADPEQPDALHYLGVLSHQLNREDEAVALIRRAVALVPDYADAYNNLGNVLKEQDRLGEAAEAYRTCIRLQPDHADAHSNLGTVLREQAAEGEADAAYAEAERAYRRAIDLNPEHADAFHNLGNVLKKQGRIADAAEAYRQAIAIRPYDPDAYKSLGVLLYRHGQAEAAAQVFEQWLSFDGENPVARHMYASCSGKELPRRASDAYVQDTFDSFAQSFDQVLTRLEYRAPELVHQAFTSVAGPELQGLSVLDAGCGTGLCGPLFRPHAARLWGVDLSPRMLEKARERGDYDELVEAELVAYLREQPGGEVDLIVSADTLCYFGDLGEVLPVAAVALRAGGRLVFTLEELAGDAEDEGYRLNPHGRYCHREGYVRERMEGAGLALERLARDTLRLEAGEPVAGLIVVARRP